MQSLDLAVLERVIGGSDLGRCGPGSRWQFLGNVYSSGGDYRRAIECYEEVVASGLVDVEPRFVTSLVNLAVSCAKAGLGDRCVRSFSDLVTRFPTRVEHVRTLLARKQAFLDLLARKTDLRDSLRRQVPGLFAA